MTWAGSRKPIKIQYLAVAATILVAMGLASCDSREQDTIRPPTMPPVPVNAALIRVELKAPGSIALGESVQLTATAVRSDSSVENVSGLAQWTSSDRAVLEISSTGVATAIARGEAMVTVRYQTRGASTRTLVLPAGTYRLNGAVTDSGFGIAGVRVTVIGGVGADLTTITDGQGMYVLYGVRDRVRLQAKSDGYVNRIEEIDVADHRTFNFEIVPQRRRPDVRGDYRLTIDTKGCSPLLPQARSYDATVSQDGSRISVRLSGADFIVTRGQGNGFSGFIDAGDRVTFAIGEPDEYYYYYREHEIVERISPTRSLIISGRVTAGLSPLSISGVLNGVFVLAQGVVPPFRNFDATCFGTAHRFEMVRRQ